MLPFLLRALRSRAQGSFRALLVVLIGVLLIGAPSAIAVPIQPAAAAIESADGVTVSVAPAQSSYLSPGQDLRVAVSIANGSDEVIPVATVHIYLAGRALTSQAAVADWLAASNEGGAGDLLQSFPTRTEILPGSISNLELTVPAASVGLGTSNAWGARGIAATLETGGSVAAEGRGTFVWVTGQEATPVNVAVVAPITTPAGSDGLLPASALETFTAPTGLLTRQLEGVLNRPVAIGVDPMIIASIRVLGNAAPASAVAWLETLERAANDIFPLGYADADISLEAQAGASTLLGPISFEQAIDRAGFTGPSPRPTSGTGTDEPESTPEPTPTPGPVTTPTTEELLAWDYTVTNIGWPTEGTVSPSDLAVFAASGLTTSILSESQVTRPEKDLGGNAMVSVGGHLGLVTDDNLSNAIRRAATSTSDEDWTAAMSEAIARLAVVSADAPGTPRTILATLDRGWPPTADRLSRTLDALAAVPWETSITLAQALAEGPTSEAMLEPGAHPATRLEPARTLLQREAEITAFSTALASPLVVTGEYRLDLLALYAAAWAPDQDGWLGAVRENVAESTEVLQSVTVTTKGPINVLASQVDIPLTLSNAFEQPVTVRVQLTPSNGRLVVGSEVEATVDAESARTIKVPVSAKVGNGDVTLRVSVFSPTGVLVSQPGVVDVNVQAEWEGVGSAVFAVLVVLFFGFGVWRNIARRRKERVASSIAASEADAGSSGTATPSEPTGTRANLVPAVGQGTESPRG